MSKRIDKKFPQLVHVTRDYDRNEPEGYLVAHEGGPDDMSMDDYDGAEVAIYRRVSVHKFQVSRTLDAKPIR